MPIFSSLLLDPTGLASTLASGVVEKPQEVDESFQLARPVCGVPGVSAAVPDDSSRWGQPLFFTDYVGGASTPPPAFDKGREWSASFQRCGTMASSPFLTCRLSFYLSGAERGSVRRQWMMPQEAFLLVTTTVGKFLDDASGSVSAGYDNRGQVFPSEPAGKRSLKGTREEEMDDASGSVSAGYDNRGQIFFFSF